MARNIRFEVKNGPPTTGECDICGERTYLPFQCKKCLGIFCDQHHLPENHSCVPISKIIDDFNQFCEREFPMDEREKIQNKIQEINRIIVRLQAMYEGGEIERSDYLDKWTSFEHDRVELETKLKLFDRNNEKATSVIEKQESILEYSESTNNYSYTVDDTYKREYVGNIYTGNDNTNKNFEVEDSILTKNRCQFCYAPINGIPFKCRRCGLSYCADHRLPEYHWCASRKKYYTNDFINKTKHSIGLKYNRVKNWLKKRNHRKYHNWNTFFKNLFWVIILSVSFLIIYSNIEKLNELIIWLIPLGNALLFLNGILWIKYTYGFLKRLNYWFKGERNWVRCLTVLIVVSLIWHAYQQKETVLNPINELNKDNLYSKFEISLDNFSTSNIFYIQPEQKNESKDAFNYLNQLRKQNNRRIIEWDDKIYELAVARSKDMYEKNYFDHTTPEGKCVKDFQSAYGLNEYTIAENLGAQYEGYNDRDMSFSKKIDVRGQVDGWMSSRGHRYNLMYPDHVKGAIGCYYGVCAFLGANTDPYGLGSGPCTTGGEGLAFWKSVGKQPGEI